MYYYYDLGGREIRSPMGEFGLVRLRSSLRLNYFGQSSHLAAQPDEAQRAKTGVPGRSRTCDLRIRSPSLYPAELRALKIMTRIV